MKQIIMMYLQSLVAALDPDFDGNDIALAWRAMDNINMIDDEKFPALVVDNPPAPSLPAPNPAPSLTTKT